MGRRKRDHPLSMSDTKQLVLWSVAWPIEESLSFRIGERQPRSGGTHVVMFRSVPLRLKLSCIPLYLAPFCEK